MISEKFSSGVVGFPINPATEDLDKVVQAFERNGYTVNIEFKEDGAVIYIGIPERGIIN